MRIMTEMAQRPARSIQPLQAAAGPAVPVRVVLCIRFLYGMKGTYDSDSLLGVRSLASTVSS